mmetsp:Transcript_46688/g.91875  ORF Transcript_46688/g.91875 Transcript_46688/m.91875 type:complete len:1069 (-) Transcript_46688:57-3263(-)|eukprot:CAMPEP_0175088858 /NCGR_PEP_ID=MMETSP0086_2-20121207/474_1 /TAXON_ID=136419 /ORGANISM="Unknown Unknown, Strain D1" /LENGTH=1068 /DNA_ID=CAMNT_0016361323 /DNA_START=56 /DNA_END=3262 /DNA_ORIENTATION=-
MADKEEKKGTQRRDTLIAIQTKVQQQWDDAKAFEVDPPEDKLQPKFFGTFPYPYMNGVLHLGHAFTLSKVDFATRFHRLLGERALFPFGFHCTGMPIAACADKLKREVEKFGNPPIFPDDDEPEEKKAAPTKKKKEAKKKSGLKYQWQILGEMGVPENEIARFQDPRYWLGYFPPIAVKDLTQFGLNADFRRAFITTDANPYYDSFIRWQFNTLKAAEKVLFGTRLSIFSPIDNQPCADHDRASGEGVGPQEYTLIKLKLCEPYPPALDFVKGKKVFLPAATLRPETMYGQTNCFLLPDGDYGVYEVNGGDVFVQSERSALNMSYQAMTPEHGKPSKLGEVKGSELIGCAVNAPLAKYDKVYVLPLLTIKMDKGTGVVTSVPSDAPDDFAALNDLKKSAKERAKYNLTDDMVLPFEVVGIIDTPGLGTTPAADLCKQMGVKSQQDRKKLDDIKAKCYLDGFTKGVMIVGEHKGTKVSKAKPLIKEMLVKQGDALLYSEPESKIMSRSGGECVVALVDQWYLNYGEEKWAAAVGEHLKTMETYAPATQKKFEETLAWLHEWACSRGYGLGTRLPWDTQFVIESLSDSTIYMAYYTVVHQLQGGVNNMDGQKTGPAGIPASKMTHDVWNYLFLHKVYPTYPSNCGISQAVLDKLRGEFEYWYPMDLRVSGKDLIGNHLTMALYNHAAIWDSQPEMWPRSYFTNGHLMINGDKMSKSTGNFMTIVQACEEYGADATRLALADAGDGLLDANFEGSTANSCILRLTKEEVWWDELCASKDLLQDKEPSGFYDDVFDSEMNRCIAMAREAYQEMKFHNALVACFFDMWACRDNYRSNCSVLNKRLVGKFMRSLVVMLSPVCPHWTQHMWSKMGQKGLVMDAAFPTPGEQNLILLRKVGYLREVSNSFRSGLVKQQDVAKKHAAKNKGKGSDAAAPPAIDTAVIYVAASYPDWQAVTLKTLRQIYDKSGSVPNARELAGILAKIPELKPKLKNAMAFAAQSLKEVELRGLEALDLQMPFDEVALLNEHSSMISGGCGLATVTVEQHNDPEDKSPALPGKPKAKYFNAAAGLRSK